LIFIFVIALSVIEIKIFSIDWGGGGGEEGEVEGEEGGMVCD